MLASRSPRRREILGWLGLEFESVDPGVEELSSGLEPRELVVENARRKAAAGAALANPGSLVLGVDTDVFVDGRALGKPTDRAGAEQRLRKLSGREHEVLSGVCLAGPGAASQRVGCARSVVRFESLDERLLRAYLDSGEWAGRAGAYSIQGIGSAMVAAVDGDFSNVVGLPIRTLLELEPALSGALAGETPHP